MTVSNDVTRRRVNGTRHSSTVRPRAAHNPIARNINSSRYLYVLSAVLDRDENVAIDQTPCIDHGYHWYRRPAPDVTFAVLCATVAHYALHSVSPSAYPDRDSNSKAEKSVFRLHFFEVRPGYEKSGTSVTRYATEMQKRSRGA